MSTLRYSHQPHSQRFLADLLATWTVTPPEVSPDCGGVRVSAGTAIDKLH